MRSLYEITGDIGDFNTLLVNRGEFRNLPEAMWDRFIEHYARKHGFVDKAGKITLMNFTGGIEGYRKDFIEAQNKE